MTSTIVSQVSRNGHSPVPVTRLIPRAASRADELLKLRSLIRDAQTAERAATHELVELMQDQGVKALQGAMAVAVLERRECLTVDVELFREAAGARASEALTVRVEAARTLVGGEILRAISEITATPVLRVEPLASAAA